MNHRIRIRFELIGPALVAIAAAGCGGAFESTLKGAVTLDGEPIHRGTITLTPTDTSGSSAYAKVEESGDYRVQTGREFGLPAGDYRVAVVARERPASLYGEDGGPPPAGRMITPEWYRSPDTSGLSFSVKPGGNRYDIQLTSDPPPGWEDAKKTARRR